MYYLRHTILKFPKYLLLALLFFVNAIAVAQTTPASTKLPQAIFLELINSTDKFEINHATEFKHVDLPKSYYNTFLSYIKDSAAVEIPSMKSLVYYNFILHSGKVINGDIYWNDSKGYIVFKINNKRYVNYFTKEGITQLKSIFKL